MSNQSNTTEQPVGVIQTSYTVAITFTDKPSVEMRQRLKSAGYQFDKGRWYRNQSDSQLAASENVDQLLAA